MNKARNNKLIIKINKLIYIIHWIGDIQSNNYEINLPC